MRFLFTFTLLLCLSGQASAWWNEDWPYRLPITLDTTATGANIAQTTTDAPVLIRLHSANFEDFFLLQDNLRDVRFIGGDDKIPLSFHVESFDLINQLAYIWVKVPQVSGQLNAERIWMYYGNDSAVQGANAAGTYDVDQVAIFHFSETTPVDQTAYGSIIAIPEENLVPATLIAGGVSLPATTPIAVTDQPALMFDSATGYTLSMWVKPEGVQANASLLERSSAGNVLRMAIDDAALFASFDIAGKTYETPRSAPLTLDSWQHVALTVTDSAAMIYVNGAQVSAIELPATQFNGDLFVGSSSKGENALTGLIDELSISKVARPSEFISLLAKSQGISANLTSIAKAEQLGNAAGTNYFVTIFQNTGTEGWVVIVLLTVMAVLSWIVMAFKAMFLGRVRKDNVAFMKQYQKLSNHDIAALDRQDDPEIESDSDVLFGENDHFQASALYHVYHRGIAEVRDRIEKGDGRKDVLNEYSVNSIRSGLEAYVTREIQALNRNMVLLTIAVSGGPFLGLLGTVLGVMITFAAIAASGDVNIAAIAPGVAAALLTTVFGLIVAIPALFGYNYLASKIKSMVADMHVFTEEFVTKLAEHYSAK